jgi:acetate kinase
MNTALLILHAGSSSLKFAVYQVDAVGALQAEYRGLIDGIGAIGGFRVWRGVARMSLRNK